MTIENINGYLIPIPNIEDLKNEHKKLEDKMKRKKKEISDVQNAFKKYKENI